MHSISLHYTYTCVCRHENDTLRFRSVKMLVGSDKKKTFSHPTANMGRENESKKREKKSEKEIRIIETRRSQLQYK